MIAIFKKVVSLFKRNDVDYFEMFVEGSKISLKAAVALQTAFADEVVGEKELNRIREIEHEGDRLVVNSLKLLEEAFITPIDQEELLDILKAIEEVTDHIDDVASHSYMLNITQKDEYIDGFIVTMVQATEKLVLLMETFHDYKHLDFKKLNELIYDINALEEAADRIYQNSMKALFTQEKDAIMIIRKKEIYLRLEDVLDSIEDVANHIRRILISSL